MNDLKTLIDISFTGTRLPQYEEEIFSNNELTEYYLRKLCWQYNWYYHDDSVPRMAYYYARLEMKSRWPEVEHIIATDAPWACNYASDVIETRWPEAEHIIATIPICAYRYARYVMKSRWPEAEHIIATSPQWAYCYAANVMESRWPEAEAVIAASRYREWYNQDLGTNI